MENKPIDENYVEIYAQACYDIILKLGIQDGHCKSYDPMTIDTDNKIAHSYVFDLWDGGRHHPYESLEQIKDSVLEETVKCIENEYKLKDDSWITK